MKANGRRLKAVATTVAALRRSVKLELRCRSLTCAHWCTDSRWAKLPQSNVAFLCRYFPLLLYFVHNCCIYNCHLYFWNCLARFCLLNWHWVHFHVPHFACYTLHATCRMLISTNSTNSLLSFRFCSKRMQMVKRMDSKTAWHPLSYVPICACHCVCCKMVLVAISRLHAVLLPQ